VNIVFLRDNTGNIGGLEGDLSLGSNRDIRSPDGITNYDHLKAAPDLTDDNVRTNLVEEEENNVDQDNVHPPIERHALLLYLKNGISLDKESKTLEIVKMAKNKGICIILVHEQDIDKGGCPLASLSRKHRPSCLILPSSYSDKLPFHFTREMNIV